MQEEGYSSIAQLPPIKFTFESGSPDLANEVTTSIGMWQRNLGVTVGTSVVDFNTLLTATANTTGKSPAQGGLQMWALGWIADYPDPQDWTTLLFGAGSSSNNWNYGNNNCTSAAAQQANQAAMAAADVNLDPTARPAAINKIEQEMVNEVAWLSLYQSPYGPAAQNVCGRLYAEHSGQHSSSGLGTHLYHSALIVT